LYKPKNCKRQAGVGDKLRLDYEARLASEGAESKPFDAGKNYQFQLGARKVSNFVE